MASTIYETTFKYVTDDKATAGILGLTAHIGKAERAALSLKTVLMGLGTGLAFNFIKKHFIDFNSSMQQAQNTINTVLMSTYNASYEQAQQFGKKTLDELLQYSKKAPGAFQDYVEGFSKITAAARGIKAPLSEMTGVTEKLVAISRGGLFNGQEDTLIQEVAKFLGGGQIVHRGPVPLLISMMGSTVEEVRKLNQKQRYEFIKAGENSAAFKRAILEGAKSWDAVFNSFKDNINIFLGKVGAPLFKSITQEIMKWSEWFDKNQEKVEQIARTMSTKVVTAFDAVKSAVGFIIDHKEALISIATAFAGIKGGLSFASAGLSVAKMTAGVAGVEAIGGTIAGVLGLSSVIVAVAGLAVAVGLYLGMPNAEERAAKVANQRFQDATGWSTKLAAHTNDAMQAAKKLEEYEALNKQAGKYGMHDSQRITAELMSQKQVEISKDIAETLAWIKSSNAIIYDKKGNAVGLDEAAVRRAARGASPLITDATEERFLGAAKTAYKLATKQELAKDLLGGVIPPKIDVNVVMHVASEDPDRFAMNFKKVITNVIRRPTIAKTAWRDGL